MTRPVRAVRSWCARSPDGAVAVVLALASYVPILLTSPGRVSADTKTYLTLDPGAVLDQARSMWDPSVGAGTVPHQNIGFLFPLGPFYWVAEQLGIPDWLTQRLLWGTLVFAAAYGMYRLARWLGWGVTGAFVAAFAYSFSPYMLSYLARLSVILGPWAALPWMILLAAKAARTRSWRPAAQFAVVVALVGSVNATALVLAGLGPVIWLVSDVLSGRVAARAAIAGAARIGVLGAAVSLWWIVALSVQGNYGIPILRYTETYESVAGASTPAEIMRHLGYWFFYGGDQLDLWVGPSLPYFDHPALIALGFTLAGVSLLGLLVAFAGRTTAAVILLIGLAVSVGAAPLGDSTPYGSVFEWFASDTTVGLALRSTPRAAPLVILALAFGLASSSEWLRERVRAASAGGVGRSWGLLVPVAVTALLVVQLFPWFTADSLTPSLLRDETPPAHVTDLAAWLDATVRPEGTGRVYEIPAADFANYRWGGTVDPVLPGLIDRPYLARELVPQGGAATADLLNAFERRIAEGWFEPETLVPIADRLGVDTIVVRNDLEHERYRLARPGPLWTDVSWALGEPDHAGPVVADVPVIPIDDERTLADPDAAEEFPVVAAFDLTGSPAVNTTATSSPIVLAGNGEGLVDMAGAGLLEPDHPVLYAATLADLADDDRLDPVIIGTDPWWVISDTNRRQGRRWSTVSSNLGALETADPIQLDDDPGNNQLDVFGDDIERQTIAVHRGAVAAVSASYYGNRIAYTPEDAPWMAIDGDPTTAWRAGVFDETIGLVWEVDLVEPAEASTITVLQPITGAVNRYITEVRLTLDGDTSLEVALDDRSRAVPGQPIELPAQSFRSLRIEILADSLGKVSNYNGQPGVGFAEIAIPGVADDRVVRLPSLDAFPGFGGQRLTYLMTRQRIDPATRNRSAPEPFLVREIDVPSSSQFRVSGEARLSAAASDAVLLEVLDDPSMVVADRRLPGNPDSRGASAHDGDRATAWQTPFGGRTDGPVGATLTIDHAVPVAADTITVSWLDDALHSAPAELLIVGDDGRTRTVTLEPSEITNGIATATAALESYMSGHSVITVSAITDRTTLDYFSGTPRTLPVGLTDVRFGDAPPPSFDRAVTLSDACRRDLLTIDGEPVPVRVIGDRGEALERDELAVEACDGPVVLSAGPHRIEAAPGAASGFDIDRLVLDDDPVGAATPTERIPAVVVDRETSTEIDVRVAPSTTPSWSILQQSWNEGWSAVVEDGDGDRVDLGTPILINGYANGWILPPSDTDRAVYFEWKPQRSVRIALWMSLAAGVGVIGLAVFGRRSARVDEHVAERRRRAATRRRSPWLAASLVAAVGFVAGPLVALFALISLLLRPHLRWLAAATVVVAGSVVAGAIVALEWRHDYPAGPDWPDRFGWTATLVWIAVATVVVAAIMPFGVTRRAQTDVADTHAS